MSGMRGTPRSTKIKLLVRVQRLDRSNRFFHANLFFPIQLFNDSERVKQLVQFRLADKYAFPVRVVKVHVPFQRLMKAA